MRALLEGVSAAEETRRYEEEHFEVGLGKPGGLRELAEESRARMWEQRRGQVEQNQKGDEQEDVIPAIGPTKVTLDEVSFLGVQARCHFRGALPDPLSSRRTATQPPLTRMLAYSSAMALCTKSLLTSRKGSTSNDPRRLARS